MTTLFDKFLNATYEDVVQLGRAGAGAVLGEGENVLIKDGVGDPIISRLAVQHHLNAAESNTTPKVDEWEFSSQADGAPSPAWTNDTGIANAVRNGRLVLDYTPDQDQQVIGAYQTVNLTGDFDFITASHGFGLMEVGRNVNKFTANCLMLADSVNSKCSGVACGLTGTRTRAYYWVDQTYPVAEALTYDNENMYHDQGSMILRVCRYSGTIYVAVGNRFSPGSNDAASVLAAPAFEYGWFRLDSVADANTYDRAYLGIFFQSGAQAVVSGRAQFPFMRRYK